MLIEKVITSLIIVILSLFVLMEGIKVQNNAKDTIENVNEHNKQLEIIIEEMEE